MKFESLRAVFDAFKGLKVLIVGDVMIDTYIYGVVNRISPEAPVPVLNVSKRESRLGGAANVALNIQALGAEPILCSVIGTDSASEEFKSLLNKQQLSSQGIIASKKRITTVKNRFLSGSQHILRVDEEDDQQLSVSDRNELVARIKLLMDKADVVIFEDYDKGCLDSALIQDTIRAAHLQGIKVAVDPKNRNFQAYKNCDLFKPNLRELSQAVNKVLPAINLSLINKAVAQIKGEILFNNALITLSDQGIYFINAEENGHYPAHIRRVSDVSGAGDTVISIAALCMALDLPIQFYAELSNLGGGLACEQQGVVPVDVNRLFSEAEKSNILGIFD